MRTLRVLSAYPGLGKPNDVLVEFEGAQAYVDAGIAEWVRPPGGAVVDLDPGIARVDVVETTAAAGPVETTSRRPASRVRRGAVTSRYPGSAAAPGTARVKP